MLAAIAAEHGARHVETLTGFKWLARADVDVPGSTLMYAYEEAIGHCVDPAAVRDKDGISTAVLACDLVAALKQRGHTVVDVLDDLARRHGVHVTAAVSRPVADAQEAAAVMFRLRGAAPERLGGFDMALEDLATDRGSMRTDAVILSGGDGEASVRVVARPSGTEPKVKFYIEIRCGDTTDLSDARARAERLRDDVTAAVEQF
jgi:phosphomannomutase